MLEALWRLIIGWGLIIYGIVDFEQTLRSLIFHQPKDLFHANVISD